VNRTQTKAAGEKEKSGNADGVKKEEEDEEERQAREMVERAYAAANQASAGDDASETASIDQKDEAAYEANIDEAMGKKEKQEQKKMQS
jgi:hypothetical protein